MANTGKHYNIGKNNPMYNKKPWNNGLTKDIDFRIRYMGKKHSNYLKGYWDSMNKKIKTERFSGINNPFYGRHHSEETKKKISKPRTEEAKKKMSEIRKKMITEKKIIMPKGKDSPSWKGGKSFEPYGLEFNNELKERVRIRDKYRCQECFRHQEELYTKTGKKYKLHIHHIDFNKRNNNPDNLISLCRNCHAKTYYNSEDWIKYFKNKTRCFLLQTQEY